MQLAPLCNSRCGQRTLQAWPGRYGAFFLLPFPFCLTRENMVVVPMFDRVHKDWFDVCLCLWIVKTIMPPESGHDPLGRRSFFLFSGLLCLLYLQLWDVSMSSHDVSFLWDVSDEIWGRIFSSCYDPVLPPAMQWQCPKHDEAYCSAGGEEYEWCVHFFVQFGCAVVTVSASSGLANGMTLMLFTMS